MNADEIVKKLHELESPAPFWSKDDMAIASAAIGLIESLQAQLSASQRRADAAVEDIYKMADGECDVCKHYNPDKNTCAKPFVHYDDCFEWRGPQAGEGERDGL